MAKLILFIFLFIISYFGISHFYFASHSADAPTNIAGNVISDTKQISKESYQNSDSSQISVDGLKAGSTVKIPLRVTGKAKGSWYFEGSFPVYVRDNKGEDVGYGIAEAQGSWMTETPVPFVVDIFFTKSARTGSIVFHNDNPSGEESRDKSFTIPVSFTQ